MTSDTSQSSGRYYPIQDAFQKFYPSYREFHDVTPEQDSTAECIMDCKTGKLGYNISYCPKCHTVKIHACSCNNRNCPCCQAPMEQKWVCAREAELIPGCAYYHVVFTVPHELNELFRQNQKLLYSLLFSASADTLITLCHDKKHLGATPGIISVLHTWGAKLNYHPHLHCCVSGGGLTSSGQFVEGKHKGFLIPEPVVGKMFRGKFLAKLKTYYDNGSLELHGRCMKYHDRVIWSGFIDSLYRKSWVPFLKETFNGNGNAVKYLARYAYRTAISNNRIDEVTATEVVFHYKDYADQGTTKTERVDGHTFIRLFLQHVLPKGFTRVRFYGFLNNARRKKNLQLIHQLRNTVPEDNQTAGKSMAELIMTLYHRDICSCEKCGGKMKFYPRGAPRPAYIDRLLDRFLA